MVCHLSEFPFIPTSSPIVASLRKLETYCVTTASNLVYTHTLSIYITEADILEGRL